MPWKPEYAQRRKEKYHSDPEYRAKRIEQSGDPEKRRDYMREYAKSNREKFRRTPEQQAEYNRKRRERYANDKEYRDREKRKVAEYQRSNPEKRFADRLKKYGITPDEYRRILNDQNEGCAICGSRDSGCSKRERLHVDHCHESGKVRGLLCTNCNQGIGKFKDEPERLRAAARYLEASAD